MKHISPFFKKIILLSAIVICIPLFLQAQLSVTTTMTPQQLVQNVLVGTGVTVSNITYSGAAGSIGRFITGASPTNLGIASGIVMSTGLVNGTPAIGSPVSGFISNSNGTGSDPQLQSLIPGYTINDASVLQFDFVPLSDTIKFRYVFGSEEYPEWVSSNFNDVFGFFVSGPNPAGGTYTNYNIARIPGTTLPVTIDNVNSGSYSMYYVNNEGIGGATIVYDGFTTVFTAWCRVVPCMTYHLKLAIGDAGDSAFDSAVFLEENSFSTSAVTVHTYYTTPSAGGGSNAVEGCSDAVISFRLPNITNIPYPISYSIQGTATNGADYTTITNNVVISAGQDSVDLVITPIMDGITEGTETVILIVQTTVCGGSDTVTVNIIDNAPIYISASNDTMICGGSATIWANTVGGQTPYVYNWDNGLGNVTTAVVSPTATTTYNVTVTDVCGASDTESVTISIGTGSADAGPDQTICIGQNATLSATGGTSYLWSTGDATPSIIVSPFTTTTYYITVSSACDAVDSVTVFVNPLPVVTATANPTSIYYSETTTICGAGASTYQWVSYPPDPTLVGQAGNECPVVSPTETTTYMVTGIDANGCSNTDTATVVVIPAYPDVDFYAYPESGCEPLKVFFYDSSSKVAPGAAYYWDFGNGTFSYDENPIALYTESGVYDVTLTITNPGNFAASHTHDAMITVYKKPFAIFSSVPENSTTILDPAFIFYDNSIGSPVSWFWDFGDGEFDTVKNAVHNYSDDDIYYHFPVMEYTGIYTITFIATTEHGCSDTAYKQVRIEPDYAIYVPNAFSPNNDSKNQYFLASSYGVLESGYKMIIYNRWGQQVFMTGDMYEGWDGNYNGKPAETGAYIYIISFLDSSKIQHQVKGHLHLFR